MNQLPNEILLEILNFTYNCKKERNYILNKNFLKIHNNKCEKCKFIYLLHKNLC